MTTCNRTDAHSIGECTRLARRGEVYEQAVAAQRMRQPELVIGPRSAVEVECPTCARVAVAQRHPCRFAKACSCWHGEPCDGSGKVASA